MQHLCSLLHVWTCVYVTFCESRATVKAYPLSLQHQPAPPPPAHISLFVNLFARFLHWFLSETFEFGNTVSNESQLPEWLHLNAQQGWARISSTAKESKRLRHPLRTHRTLFLQQQLWTTKWSRKLIRTIKPDWGKCLKSCNLFVGLHIKCLNYGKGPGKNW